MFVYKTDDKWITYLLKYDYRIKQRIDLYLLTDKENDNENLGIVTNKTGRENEDKIIRKITNKDYIYRIECLKCLEAFYEELDPLTKDIINLRFKRGYTCERVGFEVGYSRSSIFSIVKKVRDELLERIKKIEYNIYCSDDK